VVRRLGLHTCREQGADPCASVTREGKSKGAHSLVPKAVQAGHRNLACKGLGVVWEPRLQPGSQEARSGSANGIPVMHALSCMH
jgi:hypothetical protein